MGATSSSSSTTSEASTRGRSVRLTSNMNANRSEFVNALQALLMRQMEHERPQQQPRRSAPPPPPRTSSISSPPESQNCPQGAMISSEIEDISIGIDAALKLEEDETLATLQAHLRQKFLDEIDTIQRRVSSDPDCWATLDESSDEIMRLQKLLNDTDNLVLAQPSTPATSEDNNMSDELSCPICFEIMASPKRILCCSSGHPICSSCDGKVTECPICREKLTSLDVNQRRNKFAERLVAVYLQSEAGKKCNK